MSQILVTGEAKIRDIQGPVVANSGVITALDGAASQYVRGDGTLADFPTSSGGGSSVSYYLNSSVSQGTIGGVAYRELNKEPIIGAGTDIAISSNGYVASYLTDANDPDVLSIPGGNFNCEFYFSVNNNTGNPFFYAELYKYDGTTFTLLGSSVGVPEYINQGTIIAPYYFAIPVPTSALAVTDRLAIRIYVNVDGRTVTLHTENSHLCQVVTTLSKGMVSLNNLTDQSQYLTTGTSGTDFNIVSSGDTHTFNIPSASASNRGLITTGGQTIAGSKTFSSAISADAGVLLKNGFITYANGYTSLGGDIGNLIISSSISSTPFDNELAFTPSTSNTYTFPNATGTIALTSDLSSYVPYTGATGNVDLGVYSLSAGELNIEKNGANTSAINFEQATGTSILGAGYTSIGPIGTDGVTFFFGGATNSLTFKNNLLSASRSYSLPDASGTLALTSNLSSYVPYTGATQSVNLGIYGLKAGLITTEGGYNFKILASGTLFENGYSVLSSVTGNVSITQAISAGNLKAFTFDFSAWATNTSRTYTLPDITGTLALLEGTQTFTGAKTFTQNLALDGNGTNAGTLLLKSNTVMPVAIGYASINNNANIINLITYVSQTKNAALDLSGLSDNITRTFTFPNASGTIALTSNLSSYVPYSGATAAVNLGAFGLSASSLSLTDSVYLQNNKSIWGTDFAGTTQYNLLSLNIANKVGIDAGGLGVVFGGTIGNGTYTYTLPSATGTLALTSELSAYLPLSGGTLTGGLIGTTATFSGTVSSIVTSGGTSFRVVNSVNSRAWSLVPSTNGAESDLWLYYGGTGTGTKVSFVNNGNVLIGSTTDSGELLQVNGTSKFTGALSGTSATFTNNFNGSTWVKVSNNDLGSGAAAGFLMANANGDLGAISLTSTANNPSNALFIRTLSTNSLVLGTGNTAQMYLNSSGNLGLGVTPSAWSGLVAIQSAYGILAGNLQSNILLNAYYDGSYKYVGTGEAARYRQDAGIHSWLIAPSGTAGNAISFTQAMTLFSTGNLAVGTTTDAGYKLDVNGTGRFTNTSDHNLRLNSTGRFTSLDFENNGTLKSQIFWDNTTAESYFYSGSGYLKMSNTGAATFSSSVTASGSVTSSGSQGRFGGWYDALGFTGAAVEAGVSGGIGYVIGFNRSGSAAIPIVFGNAGNTTSMVGSSLSFTGAATFSSLAGTGSRAVLADSSGTLSAPVSDISVKNNIKTIGYGLSEILKMNPVWFDFIDEYKNYGEGRQNGMIAQEVAEVIPEAVFTTPSTGKMGINYDQMHGVYIKAIQELKLEIEELKALINK